MSNLSHILMGRFFNATIIGGGGDIYVGPIHTAEIFDTASANINDSMTAETFTESLSANINEALTATIIEINEANICQ